MAILERSGSRGSDLIHATRGGTRGSSGSGEACSQLDSAAAAVAAAAAAAPSTNHRALGPSEAVAPPPSPPPLGLLPASACFVAASCLLALDAFAGGGAPPPPSAADVPDCRRKDAHRPLTSTRRRSLSASGHTNAGRQSVSAARTLSASAPKVAPESALPRVEGRKRGRARLDVQMHAHSSHFDHHVL